jgi:hypothetical protein
MIASASSPWAAAEQVLEHGPVDGDLAGFVQTLLGRQGLDQDEAVIVDRKASHGQCGHRRAQGEDRELNGAQASDRNEPVELSPQRFLRAGRRRRVLCAAGRQAGHAGS